MGVWLGFPTSGFSSVIRSLVRMIDLIGAPCALLARGRVRSFLFHSVAAPGRPTSDTPMHSVAVAEAFFDWIAAHATTVSPTAAIPGSCVERSEGAMHTRVLLTFDDGCEDNYTVVFPALLERRLIATFFIPIRAIGRKGHLTRSMIQEMGNHGMAIGSHTVNHPHLPRQSVDCVRSELNVSKAELETLTGRPCVSLAYPYGEYTPMVCEIAQGVGYQCAFKGSPVGRGTDAWAIPRTSLPDPASNFDFVARIYGCYELRKRTTERVLHFVRSLHAG